MEGDWEVVSTPPPSSDQLKAWGTQYATKHGVDPSLVLKMMQAESGNQAGARSLKGAIGPMQLMPNTAKELGVDINNPEQNIEGGVRYLKQQLSRFGSPALAAAAYNAGPTRVAQAGGIPQIPETQKYVQKVTGAAPASSGDWEVVSPPASTYNYAGPADILKNAGHAVVNSFTHAQDTVDPATPESNLFAQVARPVARAGLNVTGKVFAPAAGIGSIAGDLAYDASKAVGLPEGVADVAKPIADIATQVMLPTGLATGGLSRGISKIASLAEKSAVAKPVAAAVKEAGGTPANLVTKIATGIAEPATGQALEQTGQGIAQGQREASSLVRGIGGRAIQGAIDAIPAGQSVSSDFAKVIAEHASPIKTGASTTSRQIDSLAKELAPQGIGLDGMLTSTWAGKTKLTDLSKDIQEQLGQAFGDMAGGGGQVDMSRLDKAKQTINRLWRTSKTDDDRRLLTMAQNAIEADINKFGPQYPEAVQAYKQANEFWKTEVAQYHSKGSPLRELVEPKGQLAPASEIVDNLKTMPVEHIRNVINGLSVAPEGAAIQKTIGDTVLGRIFEAHIDRTTDRFNINSFVKDVNEPLMKEKLVALLGPQKMLNLENFIDAGKQVAVALGDNVVKHNNPMMRTMGYFHLFRGATEAAVGLPMALYQLSAAGSMLLTPKLMGMIGTSSSSKALAALMQAQPSRGGMAAAQVLGQVAKSLGAVQIPAAARGLLPNGNNQVQ